MAENESHGISRRDLLKRGAALGGAVVWATPVVQTLGMGRAFAQSASPIDVSYIALFWQENCDSGDWLWAKSEDNGTLSGYWDPTPGATPGCSIPGGVVDPSPKNGSSYFIVEWKDGCVTVKSGPCGEGKVLYVAKGGASSCKYGTLGYNTAICLDPPS